MGWTGAQGWTGETGPQGPQGDQGRQGGAGDDQKLNSKLTLALIIPSASALSHSRQFLNANISFAKAGATGLSVSATFLSISLANLNQGVSATGVYMTGCDTKEGANEQNIKGLFQSLLVAPAVACAGVTAFVAVKTLVSAAILKCKIMRLESNLASLKAKS